MQGTQAPWRVSRQLASTGRSGERRIRASLSRYGTGGQKYGGRIFNTTIESLYEEEAALFLRLYVNLWPYVSFGDLSRHVLRR